VGDGGGRGGGRGDGWEWGGGGGAFLAGFLTSAYLLASSDSFWRETVRLVLRCYCFRFSVFFHCCMSICVNSLLWSVALLFRVLVSLSSSGS